MVAGLLAALAPSIAVAGVLRMDGESMSPHGNNDGLVGSVLGSRPDHEPGVWGRDAMGGSGLGDGFDDDDDAIDVDENNWVVPTTGDETRIDAGPLFGDVLSDPIPVSTSDGGGSAGAPIITRASSIGSGATVTLGIVPEPATGGLLLLAAPLALRRRRR